MVSSVEIADTVSHSIRSYMPCRQAVLLTFPRDLSNSSPFFALLHQPESHLLFFQSPAHSLRVYPGWHQKRSPSLQTCRLCSLRTAVKSFRSNTYKKAGGGVPPRAPRTIGSSLGDHSATASPVAHVIQVFHSLAAGLALHAAIRYRFPSDRGRFPNRRRRIRRGMAWLALPRFPVLITSTGI